MGKSLTSVEVEEILKSGKFDEFIGTEESNTLEAKPLSFVVPTSIVTDPTDKAEKIWKLARVIGNLANSEGGHIIIGLDAQSTNKSLAEEVTGVIPFNESEMPHLRHVENMIQKHIFPVPKLECHWYPGIADPKSGLGAIHVLESNVANQRFLMMCDSVGEFKGKLFGIPIRKSDEGDWEDVSKLWEIMRKKPTTTDESYSNIMTRLEELTLVVEKGYSSKDQPPQQSVITQALAALKKELATDEQ
jgi:hypothetical protein